MSIAIRAAGVISVLTVLGVSALAGLSHEPAGLQSSRQTVMRPVMASKDPVRLTTAVSPDALMVAAGPKG